MKRSLYQGQSKKEKLNQESYLPESFWEKKAAGHEITEIMQNRASALQEKSKQNAEKTPFCPHYWPVWILVVLAIVQFIFGKILDLFTLSWLERLDALDFGSPMSGYTIIFEKPPAWLLRIFGLVGEYIISPALLALAGIFALTIFCVRLYHKKRSQKMMKEKSEKPR